MTVARWLVLSAILRTWRADYLHGVADERDALWDGMTDAERDDAARRVRSL